METTTQELIYQAMTIVISGVLGLIGVYVKNFLTTKIDIAKYGFENDKVERIITNAVNYAEIKGKSFAKDVAKDSANSKKLDLARHYINQVDKDIITKYGNELDLMIERKVAQVLG